MQRKVLGMLLVTLAAALVVGVGADFASYKATRSAHIAVVADDQELINLEPAQPYAYITGEGTLTIDLSSKNPNWKLGEGMGISPESTYDIDKVFLVSNDLWAADSTDEIKVTVTRTSVSGTGNFLLYSKLDIDNYNSNTAGKQIEFNLKKGEKGDVGLKLVGTSLGTIDAEITVVAVAT